VVQSIISLCGKTTVVVATHNRDLLAAADYIVELGGAHS